MIKAHALENALSHNGKASDKSVLSALFSEGLKKESIKETMPLIQEIVKEVNSLTEEQQKQELEKLAIKTQKRETRQLGELPPLPDAEKGGIVMRLAPFPSGPLHIGNARPYILNDEYVKMYHGKLLLVIDDTISSEIKPIEPEAYKLIPEGFDWLNVKYDKKIIYKSDRLQIYYDYAQELIKKGYMYVCNCSQEEFQELRAKGKECGCRNMDEHEHLERWEKMFNVSSKQGNFVVRLKTSMQHPNPAFRDRVMFRIVTREHPRVGKKYKVWPMLEFSWSIDDHLLGMTHILRGIDLVMETEVEKFIWDIFKWKHPVVIHTGFFAIEGVKISKSKGAQEVRSGMYSGWNDPRLWSLQSLRDRGIKPEAIREFILNMGITKANSTVAIDVLYAINRKFLEKSPRYFFVENPVKIHISGAPELEAKLPLHPNKQQGYRRYNTSQDFYISQNDFELMQDGNYRLMHLLNFKSTKPSPVKPLIFSYISEEPEEKLDVKFIHWLPSNKDETSNKENQFSNNIKVRIRMPDNTMVKGLGEKDLEKLKPGQTVQFERFGFASFYEKDKKTNELEFWFTHR